MPLLNVMPLHGSFSLITPPTNRNPLVQQTHLAENQATSLQFKKAAAITTDTKVPMVAYCTLLDTLVQLMDDSNLKTRRNAVSAIGSLAISDENSMAFVTHGEGIIVKIMRRLVENEFDAVIRRRAVRALRCFGRKDTIDMLADRLGIINSKITT